MKRFIKITSYDNNITARALLVGAYGSLTLPVAYEAAAVRGDIEWAMERAGLKAGSEFTTKGFKTLRAADLQARYLRRSIDIGQGMMKGAGLISERIFDDVKIVKGA